MVIARERDNTGILIVGRVREGERGRERQRERERGEVEDRERERKWEIERGRERERKRRPAIENPLQAASPCLSQLN